MLADPARGQSLIPTQIPVRVKADSKVTSVETTVGVNNLSTFQAGEGTNALQGKSNALQQPYVKAKSALQGEADTLLIEEIFEIITSKIPNRERTLKNYFGLGYRENESLLKLFRWFVEEKKEALNELLHSFEAYPGNDELNKVSLAIFTHEIANNSLKGKDKETVENFRRMIHNDQLFHEYHDDVEVLEAKDDIPWPKLDLQKKLRDLTAEQVELLGEHIKKGVNLIKEGNYDDAIKHFSNEEVARAAGLKLTVNSGIKKISFYYKGKADELKQDTSDSYYTYTFDNNVELPGEIKIDYTLPELTQTPNRYLEESQREERELFNKETTLLKREISFVMLEEWLHAAQAAYGTLISEGCRNIENKMKPPDEKSLRMLSGSAFTLANSDGNSISLEDWVHLLHKTFGRGVHMYSVRDSLDLNYNNLREIDIVQFLRENGLTFDKKFLQNHSECRLDFLNWSQK